MKTVLVPTLVAAKNIDTLNRSFISETDDIDNGQVFSAGAVSNQVYAAVKPATGALEGLWMAFNAEDTIITDGAGNEYKVGINDPRTYTNVKGRVFSAFKPQIGDKILISADNITGTADDYVIAVNGAYGLAYDDGTATSTLKFAVIDDAAYISIGSVSGIGSQRVAAILLECVAN